MNRYYNKELIQNENELYESFFRERNVKFINHFETTNFTFPTNQQLLTIPYVEHTWKYGDRYYKLSSKYYGDTTMWWVIAMFNNKPTEHSISIGDTILIPTLLEKLFSYMKP
jgi:hypothetical protein